MATDLERGHEQGESVPVRPNLKIVGLHIKGLKSIGSLDLPEDGLGWDGAIPDLVMVGGINGSGKTTLLEFLASLFESMNGFAPNGKFIEIPRALRVAEARIDFLFENPDFGNYNIRFLIGKKDYIDKNMGHNWFGYQYGDSDTREFAIGVGQASHEGFFFFYSLGPIPRNQTNDGPSVVYFPSERRTLTNPDAEFSLTANLKKTFQFVYRFQSSNDKNEADPLIKRIYDSRWEDLNAKEAGRAPEVDGFESYSRAFDRFFEGRKRLKWTPKGQLVVETKTGDVHDLSELSSGEKQIILFMGELLHRWRPGSLILIDEPELHLHESYQTKLWEALVDWQKERGGQVILATQSAHLFGLSGSGTRVILSRRSR